MRAHHEASTLALAGYAVLALPLVLRALGEAVARLYEAVKEGCTHDRT